jgi:beta-phosphoglucomutase-like phosphatase (HAD superfamily)
MVRAAAAAGMATIMIPDLLEPTAEIESLCVGVLPSLNDVQFRFLASREATEPGRR